MSRRWAEISALADQALRVDEAVRDEFLQDACAGDADLGRRVRALIEAGLREDGFLEPLVVGDDSRLGLGPGSTIGPFRIVEFLGEGSMGVVFVAEQDAPRRRVALKVMNDRLLTPARWHRFQYEVEALGALNHPAIAQIYQAGIHRDDAGPARRELPWFAMEYVEDAATLWEYAERESLAVPDRLRLCIRVCEAVDHGHRKGIIHRDLKPENLLVDTRGRPKVIDFGVARAADPGVPLGTMRTQAREIVGTLPYMSPEQARGEQADVQSDVYSLGAVLYEMLTGELPVPVEAQDFLTSARRIVEDPPRRPTSFRPELKGDLEAVLLKTLEKEPSKRYASAGALAADLGRILRHEPVEARAHTPLDRWRRFARRHRALVLAVAAVGLALAAATAVSLRFALASRRAEALARRQSEEADLARGRATRLFESALARGLKVTNSLTPQVHALPGGAAVAADLMEATLADLRGLEEAAGDDPVVLLALAEAFLRFGDLRGNPVVANLRDPTQAADAYTSALALAERARDGPRRAAATRIAAQALRRRSEVRQLGGHDVETREDLEQALGLLEDVAATETGGSLARIRFELGLVHHLLSVDAKGRKDLDHAESHARVALAQLEAFSESPHRHLDDADRHVAAKAYWLGVVLLADGRIDDARNAFERAVTIAARIPVDRQQRLDHALYSFALGSAERRMGRFDLADEHLGTSRAEFLALGKEDPGDPRILPHLISSSMDWVFSGDRREATARRANSDEGRRRARLAADQLRDLAPDSKVVDMYARRLEEYGTSD